MHMHSRACALYSSPFLSLFSFPSSVLSLSLLLFPLPLLIFAPLAPKPLKPSSQAQSCFCGSHEKSILFGELSTGAKGFQLPPSPPPPPPFPHPPLLPPLPPTGQAQINGNLIGLLQLICTKSLDFAHTLTARALRAQEALRENLANFANWKLALSDPKTALVKSPLWCC